MPEQSMRPYVQVAAICQAALQEPNRFLSLIRIINRFPVHGNTPTMQPQPLHNLVMVIVLRSGEMKMKCQLKVTVEPPNHPEQRDPLIDTSALFEGDDRGVQMVVPLMYTAREEGLYWFEVSVEQDVLTRIPLRVLYQKIQPMPMMPFQAPPRA
jgi:hypothetical protein